VNDNSPGLHREPDNSPMLSDSDDMQDIREMQRKIQELPSYLTQGMSEEQIFRIAAALVARNRKGDGR
jgi:hypothetical protein